MGDTSVPAVIDYLVAQIAALPACASPVVVFDGYPTSEPQTYVVIGGIGDAMVADSREVWIDTGVRHRQEDYAIICRVSSAVGSTSQKAARDAAYAVYKAIAAWLRTDQLLGGNVTPAYPVQMSEHNLRQTSEAEAESGRTAVIEFYVHIVNRL